MTELNTRILELAGFIVKINDDGRTFTISKDGKKLQGYSNYKLLEHEKFAVNFLLSYGYGEGVIAGKREIQTKIRRLLDIK